MSRRTEREVADAAAIVVLAESRRTVVEQIAEGTRNVVKRARRVDAIDGIELPPGCWNAARLYRQAYEHMAAGRGLGPMPWGKDEPSNFRGGGGQMPPQLRALTAAEWHRRGVQAVGLAASEGVVQWVVIAGLSLSAYDETRRWRRGRAKEQLVAALVRLAEEYGT